MALCQRSATLRRNRRGSVAAIVGVLGVTLVGFAALSVDVAHWEADQSAMQGAADQAVMAAGLARASGTAPAQKEAVGVAAAHGFINGQGSVTVDVTFPPASGNLTGNSIKVVITKPAQKFLSGLVSALTHDLVAHAVASPSSGKTCIVMLAPKGVSLKSSGNGSLNAKGCNIYVNSTDTCDVTVDGGASVSGDEVFLGGSSPTGCIHGNNGTVTANPPKTVTPNAGSVSDPYAARTMPPASTICSNPIIIPPGTLLPGTYCTDVKVKGGLTLTPGGTYIFKGATLDITDATLTGLGVSLVFTGQTAAKTAFKVAGKGNVTLTPLTTGAAAGIAVWIDKDSAAAFDVSGKGSLNFTGVVYAPGSNIKLSGNASSPCLQLIAKTIDFAGNSTLSHTCPAGIALNDVAGTSGYTLVE